MLATHFFAYAVYNILSNESKSNYQYRVNGKNIVAVAFSGEQETGEQAQLEMQRTPVMR